MSSVPVLPIEIVAPAPGTPGRTQLEALIMRGQEVAKSSRLGTGEPHILDQVASTPGSVGIVTLDTYLHYTDAGGIGLKLLGFEGAPPTLDSAREGLYRLTAPVELVTPEQPSGAVRAFLRWVLSEDGQAIVRQGMVGVRD
jgi:phosphate transport system substrate-binding protein